MKSVILSVPHIRQREDGECIAACAAMVLKYLNISASYEQLLRLLKIDWFGTARSVFVAEKLGSQ